MKSLVQGFEASTHSPLHWKLGQSSKRRFDYRSSRLGLDIKDLCYVLGIESRTATSGKRVDGPKVALQLAFSGGGCHIGPWAPGRLGVAVLELLPIA